MYQLQLYSFDISTFRVLPKTQMFHDRSPLSNLSYSSSKSLPTIYWPSHQGHKHTKIDLRSSGFFSTHWFITDSKFGLEYTTCCQGIALVSSVSRVAWMAKSKSGIRLSSSDFKWIELSSVENSEASHAWGTIQTTDTFLMQWWCFFAEPAP